MWMLYRLPCDHLFRNTDTDMIGDRCIVAQQNSFLNGIAKPSSNNSFELHTSKVAPFGIPKIKSGPGQSGPRTTNSPGMFLRFSLSLKPMCKLTSPNVE